MSIVRFDPLRGFETLTRRMNSLVNEFEKGFTVEYGGFAPKIDIAEDEKNLYLHCEVPGLTKENIKITISDDGVLLIKGEKKREESSEDKNSSYSYIRMERAFGEFSRSFMLPENINRESISAKFDNGVLSISLEKIEPAKPKEIEVEIA